MTNKCTPLRVMWRRFNRQGSASRSLPRKKKKAQKACFLVAFSAESLERWRRKGEETQRHKDKKKKRNIIYTFNERACPKASVFNHLSV